MNDPENKPPDAWQRLLAAARTGAGKTQPTKPSQAFVERLISSWIQADTSPLERLLSLAKTAPSTQSPAAPLGFSTRIVARWQAVRQLERFKVWRRWSLAATGCSFAILLIVSVIGHTPRSEHPIIPVPGLALPSAAN